MNNKNEARTELATFLADVIEELSSKKFTPEQKQQIILDNEEVLIQEEELDEGR